MVVNGKKLATQQSVNQAVKHRAVEEDTRTPEELLDLIEEQQRVIADAIRELRGMT